MQLTHWDSRLAGYRRFCDEKSWCVESLNLWKKVLLGCHGKTLGIWGFISKTQLWFWVKTIESKRLFEVTLRRRSLDSHWDRLIMSDLITSESSPSPEQNNDSCPFVEPSTISSCPEESGSGMGPLVISTSLKYGYADVQKYKGHVFTQRWAYSDALKIVLHYLTIWLSAVDPVPLKWKLEGRKKWLSRPGSDRVPQLEPAALFPRDSVFRCSFRVVREARHWQTAPSPRKAMWAWTRGRKPGCHPSSCSESFRPGPLKLEHHRPRSPFRLCTGKERQHSFLLRIRMLFLGGILKIRLVQCCPTQTILRRGKLSNFSSVDQLKLYRCSIYLLNSSINSGNLLKLFCIHFFYHWNKTLIHIKTISFKDEFYRS